MTQMKTWWQSHLKSQLYRAVFYHKIMSKRASHNAESCFCRCNIPNVCVWVSSWVLMKNELELANSTHKRKNVTMEKTGKADCALQHCEKNAGILHVNIWNSNKKSVSRALVLFNNDFCLRNFLVVFWPLQSESLFYLEINKEEMFALSFVIIDNFEH